MKHLLPQRSCAQRAVVCCLTLCTLSHTVLAQETGKQSANVESFDVVWSLIRERHWDEEKVGAKWDQARETFRPKVVAARSTNEARAVMTEMIGTLGQSHFAIIPARSYKDLGDSGQQTGGKGYAGLAIRMRNKELVVAQVFPKSPAEAAGIRPGWTVRNIGDRSAEEIMANAREASQSGPMTPHTMAGLITDKLLARAPGQSVRLECTTLKGQARTVDVKCAKPLGREVKFGRMPAVRIHIDSRQLDGDVGYFAFNMFFDPIRMVGAFDKRLAESTNGIVIDLRGNHGGMGGLTTALASRFADKPADLGVMQMKGAELKFALNPWHSPYKKPIAVLIDECSISAAEIMSGGLKDLGMARVFGTRTAGLALPSTFEKLPNGDGFQYAFADYHSASGETLEGKGVAPNVEVKLTPAAYKANTDPVLAAALEWIRNENR